MALAVNAQCSCYSCQHVIATEKVVNFLDAGQTGVCPECGVDALLPGLYETEKLAFIHQLFTR